MTLDAEISFHVEARTQELIAKGLDPAAARANAMREFGDVREARAELETIGRRRVRQINRVSWWSDLAQDLKYGLRSLIAAPLFSLLAIATLALGIGANAAVFSVLKSVLLDALPCTEPDRLVRLYARWLDGTTERGPMAASTIADITERQRSFERVAAYAGGVSNAVLGDESGSRIATIGWVESNFFDTLGVSAARGRTFRKDDATSGIVPLTGGQISADTAHGVLLTHAAWQRLFAGDPGVLDRDVRINGLPRRVIGILPPRFVGPARRRRLLLRVRSRAGRVPPGHGPVLAVARRDRPPQTGHRRRRRAPRPRRDRTQSRARVSTRQRRLRPHGDAASRLDGRRHRARRCSC